jgi:hypothetical protein
LVTRARWKPSAEEAADESPFAKKKNVPPNDFNGTSRKIAKTSFIEGEPTVYDSVSALKVDLTAEATMLAQNIPFGPGSEDSDRTQFEQKNVTVTAYIYAYVNEKDHDYHVLVGDAPGTPGLQYMNAEVSGLPQVTGPRRNVLQAVRTKFKEEFGLGNTGPAEYEEPDSPKRVRITGSLFFDMDHAPPNNYVGHWDFQPNTAWEIHPITNIEFLNN